MPPNHPLPDILVSGRPSRSAGRILTPRTPHSRNGRAEEGFTEVELDTFQDDESNDFRSQSQQQSQPLLSLGYRSRGDDHDPRAQANNTWSVAQSALNKIPLIGGSVLAITLLVLIAIAIQHPGVLEAAVLQATSDTSLAATATKAVPASPSSPALLPANNTFISYGNYTNFPLTGEEYRAECDKLMGRFMHHGDYWDPPRMGPVDVYHPTKTGYRISEGGSTKVCSSTITYLLDGHVGLVADLALLAQGAAFARERNHTFFVDDTHWNRGKWSDHFQDIRALYPGPEPDCLAPPPEELVACPRTSRHWVLSSSTAMFHMGHSFSEQYENPFEHHLIRLKPIFERARISFEDVIRPNTRNTALIRAARDEVASILFVPHPHADDVASSSRRRSETPPSKPALYIGVHIRRGDSIASAYPFYPDKKVPLDNYVAGARQAWDRFYSNASSGASLVAGTDFADVGDPDTGEQATDVSSGKDDHFPAPPLMWLASDSPPAMRKFVGKFSPATAVFTLEESTNSELRALAPVHDYVQEEFNAEPLEERIRSTRGMIIDLAMLSGLWSSPGQVVPGAVVCGEGSNVCRVAAYGFGFERAFGFDDDADHRLGEVNKARARWVDVDVEDRVEPAWHAFSMK